jgi:hypothetical protein
MGSDSSTFIPRGRTGLAMSITHRPDSDEIQIFVIHRGGSIALLIDGEQARALAQALTSRADPVPYVRGMESAGEILPDVLDP